MVFGQLTRGAGVAVELPYGMAVVPQPRAARSMTNRGLRGGERGRVCNGDAGAGIRLHLHEYRLVDAIANAPRYVSLPRFSCVTVSFVSASFGTNNMPFCVPVCCLSVSVPTHLFLRLISAIED